VDTEQEAFENLLLRIRDKRARISEYLAEIEPRSVRLVNIGIACGLVSAALTSAPALGGRLVTTPLTQFLHTSADASPSWRILCFAAMFCSLVAAFVTNASKAQDTASRIAKAQVCRAKLEGLETLIEVNKTSVGKAAELYGQYIGEVSFIRDKPVRDALAAR